MSIARRAGPAPVPTRTQLQARARARALAAGAPRSSHTGPTNTVTKRVIPHADEFCHPRPPPPVPSTAPFTLADLGGTYPALSTSASPFSASSSSPPMPPPPPHFTVRLTSLLNRRPSLRETKTHTTHCPTKIDAELADTLEHPPASAFRKTRSLSLMSLRPKPHAHSRGAFPTSASVAVGLGASRARRADAEPERPPTVVLPHDLVHALVDAVVFPQACLGSTMSQERVDASLPAIVVSSPHGSSV